MYRFPFPRNPGSMFDAGFLSWLPIILGVIVGLAVLCAIVLWVIRSIGLMRMAKKLGFPDPWLAWIPGANEYLFVKVAGDKRRRLGIAYMFTLWFGVLLGGVILALGCIPAMASGMALRGGMGWGMMGMGAMPLAMLPGMLVIWLALLASAVLRLILLYSVFKRFKPKSAVTFLVLSIFFKFLDPIFVLVSSFGDPDREEAAPAAAPPAKT
jgi:hypothetical protein